MMTELQDDVLEGLDAIVWEADPFTFQFSYVSRGAERLLGYSLDHWLERPAFWVDLLHPDDRESAVSLCRAAVASCRDHEFEYRMIAADGRVLWIRDIVRVVCDGGRVTGLRGVMLDVTTRKQAESAQDQSPEAQRMDALARLTRAVAHDFNNVLFTIRSYVSLALEADDLAMARRDLAEIQKAVDIGTALTSQLREFGDRRHAAPEVVDVHDTLEFIGDLLRRLLGPEVRFEVRGDAPSARVRLCRGQFEQIVMNLAANARHAMPDGGRFEIRTQVDPWGAERPDGTFGDLMIEATDTGTGIAPEIVGQIFDPYFTTKPHGQGSGLGLSTVYGIIADAGGTIAVRSALGEGATFTIRLPLA